MTTTTIKTTTDLQQFYAQLLKSPMLQEQLKAATTPENLCELAVELGKQQGYSFTKEEALAALQIELAFAGESIEVGESLADVAFRPVMLKQQDILIALKGVR